MYLYDSAGQMPVNKRQESLVGGRDYDRDPIHLKNPWTGEGITVHPREISWDRYEEMMVYMEEPILEQLDREYTTGHFKAETAGGWFARYVELVGVDRASEVYFT